jgi:Flp pilus assembly protein TadD
VSIPELRVWKGETLLKFFFGILFSTIMVRSTEAQLPIAASDLSRWLDYQERLNQSRDEMDLRSRMESVGIPGETTISVKRLRHTPPGKAIKALQRGLKLDAAGETVGSTEAFRRAVAFDPAYAEAHTDLGVEYINQGLIDDAVAEFRQATALDPATSVHHANLGLALIILGRFREAEPETRTAVTLDGTSAKAHYLLGYVLWQRPETQAAAEEQLNYAARALPEARSALAQLYRATGREALVEAEPREYGGSHPNGKHRAQ